MALALNNESSHYKREDLRLQSFLTWPSWSPARPIILAKHGFYYSGQGDRVTCYGCKSERGAWKDGEDVCAIHRNLCPECPFVTGDNPDNVPLVELSDADQNQAKSLLAWLLSGRSTFECPEGGFQQLLVQASEEYSASLDTAMASHLSSLSSSSGSEIAAAARRQRLTTDDGVSQFDASRLDVRDMRSDDEEFELSDEEVHYHSEANRLASFRNWPSNAVVRAEDLAKAGFYYTQSGDRAQCAFCRGILRNWVEGDDPMSEHRQHFPNCSFVREAEAVTHVPPEAGGSELGIVTAKPRHPEFATVASREASFSTWPPHKRQQPQELARAGFYYAGFGDNVKCFFCDGGLRNWEPSDEPWVEHAKWFPNCVYVIQSKGRAFIASIQLPQPSQVTGVRLGTAGQRNLASASGGAHHVEPRQVNARLDTPSVQAVLALGYSRDSVKKAIKKRLETTGDDFTSGQSLMQAMWAMEEEERNAASLKGQASSHVQYGGGASRSDPQPGPSGVKNSSSTASASPVKEADSLLAENRQLREERLCKICMDEDANIVFLPCGHMVSCVGCAPAMKLCPICRATIRGSVRIYLS